MSCALERLKQELEYRTNPNSGFYTRKDEDFLQENEKLQGIIARNLRFIEDRKKEVQELVEAIAILEAGLK